MLTVLIILATLFLILVFAALTALTFTSRRRPSAGAEEPRPRAPRFERTRPAPADGRAGGAATEALCGAPSIGLLTCTTGPLAGQQFEFGAEGVYIGRDGSLSQVVVNDSRVSKRHVWVGPRGRRITAVDQGSTNGTFLNDPRSERITEVFLNPGDTVILSEEDVARFQYQK